MEGLVCAGDRPLKPLSAVEGLVMIGQESYGENWYSFGYKISIGQSLSLYVHISVATFECLSVVGPCSVLCVARMPLILLM